MSSFDEISQALQDLEGDLPKPRMGLSDDDLVKIVRQLGVRTVRNIVAAKKDYPISRIPFIFSSLDTQLVVDILAHDMSLAIAQVTDSCKP
jgi:uncharacterized protein (DUF2336 family)